MPQEIAPVGARWQRVVEAIASRCRGRCGVARDWCNETNNTLRRPEKCPQCRYRSGSRNRENGDPLDSEGELSDLATAIAYVIE